MLKKFFLHYIKNPIQYSLSGLRFALQDRAFRFEILMGIIFYPLLCFHFSGENLKILLISLGYGAILTTESVNCAIEKVVDLVSPKKHLLAKQAKDIASFSVLLTLLCFSLILIFCYLG